MEHLKSRSNRQQILLALESLPSTVDKMYDQAMQRIQEDYRDLAYRVLSWVLYSNRPLTMVELQHALAFQGESAEIDPNVLDDGVFILSICCGLVILEQQSQYFASTSSSLEPNQVLTFARESP
jgi:F0F1-type ATP synthase membrane subunit a